MSKKTLLSEAQVRQFMKYANMGDLTDNFVNEMYGASMQREEDLEEVRQAKANEEDMDEGMDADAMRGTKKDDKKKKNEDGHKMEEAAHPGMDEDAHEVKEGAHDAMEEKDMMEGEHEGDDLKQALDADVDQEVEDMVAGLVSAIAAAIEDETGVDIAVDADGGEEVEMDMDADMGDMDMDMDMDVEMPGDEGPEEEEVEVDMVAEVTKRVMARIEEAKAAKKLQESRAAKIDQVADRILERIMN